MAHQLNTSLLQRKKQICSNFPAIHDKVSGKFEKT